jgi:hypothetical protein
MPGVLPAIPDVVIVHGRLLLAYSVEKLIAEAAIVVAICSMRAS